MVDKELSDIEKKVLLYEQLPDTEKINGGYGYIKNKLKVCGTKLEEIEKMLENPEKYTDVLNEDDEMSELSDMSTFELYLDRIEQISKKMDDTNLTIDDCVKLHIELHMVTKWCQEYFEKQPLEVIDMDKSGQSVTA